MAKEIRLEIKSQYALYTLLKRDKKIIEQDEIYVCDIKKSNRNFLEKITPIKHETLSNKIDFLVTVRNLNHKSFSLKFKCNDLSEKPFFGFDSDGATHRNEKENIPLDEQQIPTPHFNYYDEDGQRMAYKSDKLKDEKEVAALEDINLCIVHYCHESNMRLREDNFPQIKFKTDLFSDIDIDNSDPNSNIQFI